MAGMVEIGAGNVMEDEKMLLDDVIEEHNGIYGGEWHIISPEGLDLPEGLEYLKNTWEGSIDEEFSHRRNRIFKYNAKIKISHVDLYTSLKKVSSLLEKTWSFDTDLEFKDCPRKCTSLKIPYLQMFPFVRKLKILGCILTYKDLQDIMHCSFGSKRECYLSENTFKDGECTESVSYIEQQISILKPIQETYKVLDLRKCNFSEAEKKSLKKKLQYVKNLLL